MKIKEEVHVQAWYKIKSKLLNRVLSQPVWSVDQKFSSIIGAPIGINLKTAIIDQLWDYIDGH